MTVTANTTRNDYTAGLNQVDYEYTFQIHQASDVDVYLNGVKQTLNTHYTIDDIGNATGGTVTFTLVDENGASTPPPENAIINIVMAMDLDRDTNYQPSGAFLAADVNNDFDRLWLATNQQQTAVNRSLRLQDDDVTTSSMELPLKDARKGKLLAFNATTGDPEATSNNQSNWDTAYNNSITSASFSGSTLTLGQQDGGTITASHTPYLPIAGGTLTGDLNLGFNDLTVGNLTIENLPANATQIVETGTGNFIIKATNLFLQDANNEKYIDCTSNGDVKLYHNNSQKLATTASGISVTGTLSATGYNSGNWDTAYGWGDHSTAGYLTSYTETDPVFNAHVASGITATNITNWNDAYNNKITAVNYSGNTLTLTQQDGGTLTTTINGGGGASQWTTSGSNIYYNTGNVGIGTSTVNADLHVHKTSGAKLWITADGNNPSDAGSLRFAELKNGNNYFEFNHDGSANKLNLTSTNGDLVTFDRGTSRVGIGTTSPATTLTVGGSNANGIELDRNGADATASCRLFFDSSTSGTAIYNYQGNTLFTTGAMPNSTSGTERMRLTSSGNVGIGTTNPASALDVTGTVTADGLAVDGEANLGEEQANPVRINSSSAVGILEFNSTTGVVRADGTGQLLFETGGSTDRLKIANNGDISFYEDTGTTPKFFWDASAESLGIGTSSPDAKIEIVGNGTTVKVSNPAVTSTNTAIQLGGYTASSNSAYGAHIRAYHNFGVGGASSLVFETSGTQERMRITSDGNVGIGNTNTPQRLTVGEGTATIGLQPDATNGSYIRVGGTGTGSNVLRILGHGNAEKVRFDSSGNVGIGTDSPAANLHVSNGSSGATVNSNADDLIIESATNAGISILGDGNETQYLMFGDAANSAIGRVLYDHNTNHMALWTNANERMRLTSSGKLLIGKTDESVINTVGIEAHPAGLLVATRDNNIPLIANRKTTQGVIAQFRNDNTVVGSIGNSSTRLFAGSGATGLMYDGSNNYIVPWNTSSNTGRDGAIDLGVGSFRFKDIYLSGGVKGNNLTFSGNGSSEHARIDSLGRVGIGTSSPQAILHTTTSGSEVAKFQSTGTSPAYISIKNNGTTGITGFGSVDNDLALYSNTNEIMRMNGLGNVGIGTASPSQKLDVNGTAKATTVLSGDGTASAPAYAFSNDTDTGMFRPFPDTLAFSEGGAERMRINSAGNVGVGTTSISAKLHVNGNILATSNLSCSAGGVISSAGFMNSPAFAIKSWTSTSTTFYPMLDFRTSGNTIVGSIKSNNTSTQYNTSSDERLKENIRNAEDAGAKIDAIQIRQFDWKEGGEHQDYGVIAQELKEVAPEAVSEGYTEDDMWSVDYSKLVPTLIKEIQSLRNRVAQLENN